MAIERGVLLVGSVPLADSAAVFEVLGRHLGTAATRYPDGETGVRSNWLIWQIASFKANPQLASLGTFETKGGALERFAPKPGVDQASLSFDALGYARVAIESWGVFKRLRDDGRIPAGTRFQVSLPTPYCIAQQFAVSAAVPVVTAALARRMAIEIGEIAAAIPHADLAIQFDCVEPVVLAGGGTDLIDGIRDHFLASVPALIDCVPADAEVGVHLCYGDPGHRHVIEPVDLAICADLANALTARASRPINWIHMPVPRDRDDDAYFVPLAKLSLHDATGLYLGLVHFTDGLDGTKRRIATARRHRGDFGIATECGFGRRDPATVPMLLDIHTAALVG